MTFLKKYGKELLFFGIALLLLGLAFRGQDWAGLWAVLQKADYFWVTPILGISLCVHLLRALRWQQLLEVSSAKVEFWPVFNAMMAGYLTNYAVPRLGEIVRCTNLPGKTTENAPPALGTVITERIVDIFCLVLLFIFVFFLEAEVLGEFLQHEILKPLKEKLPQRALIFWGVTLLALLSGFAAWGLWYFRKRFPDWLWNTVRGLTSIFLLSGTNSLLFLVYTLGIWWGYFGMTWVWFFCFPESASLGVSVGLAVMAVGSLGRSLPIQGGGLGAYHFLVSQTLLLYALPQSIALALPVLIHGFQTLFYLTLGPLSILWLGLQKHKKA